MDIETYAFILQVTAYSSIISFPVIYKMSDDFYKGKDSIFSRACVALENLTPFQNRTGNEIQFQNVLRQNKERYGNKESLESTVQPSSNL